MFVMGAEKTLAQLFGGTSDAAFRAKRPPADFRLKSVS